MRHRIDPLKVAYIRRAVASGEATQTELARRYGVSHTAIWKVVNNKTYRVM